MLSASLLSTVLTHVSSIHSFLSGDLHPKPCIMYRNSKEYRCCMNDSNQAVF